MKKEKKRNVRSFKRELLAEEHWIGYWDEESRCYKYKCSKCGNEQPFDTEFYWTCGTDMRGRNEF